AGGAASHINLSGNGELFANSRTVTLTGNPAFMTFMTASMGAAYSGNNMTWAGSATGQRYQVDSNGVINTFGGSQLPGDVAGVALTGGQYL
ncbi:MAG: DUF2793 domain-containing protein, partial [Alphaproteobacteria bacterium]|nr:DUF2793 domain-containing protein [Alphaproteobacteria bacterium]